MVHPNPQARVGKVEHILCPTCNVSTKHTIRGTYDNYWEDEESGVDGGTTHDLLSCNGCSAATLRETSWFSEEPGEALVKLYPPRGDALPKLRAAKEYDCFPCSSPIYSGYCEIIAAFNHGLPILAGTGVRLVIEGICKDQDIVDGEVYDPITGAAIIGKTSGVPVRKDNLEGKINGMAEKGIVSKNQAVILHQIRFLGNDAAHELYWPDKNTLTSAIDIVEHIISQLYEQPEHAKTLAARKRPKK